MRYILDTILSDLALFHQLKYFQTNPVWTIAVSELQRKVWFLNESSHWFSDSFIKTLLDLLIFQIYLFILWSHLADAFIQSDLQMRTL